MLHLLLTQPNGSTPQNMVVTPRSGWPWSKTAAVVESAVELLQPLAHQRVGFVHRGDGPSWTMLAALDFLQADVFLLSTTLDSDARKKLAADFRLAAILDPADELRTALQTVAPNQPTNETGSVTILTSGSSGVPKAVRHTWESLSRPVRKNADLPPPVWLQTYRPNLYAGLQVALQCLVNRGTLVSPDADSAPAEVVRLMIDSQVEFVSATPSYWRRLLMFTDHQQLAAVPLAQITLGGEAIDQSILDLLHKTFPQARLVHIYATSELGRCFSVTDGRAGFPAKFVGKLSPDGVELKVENDQLWVRSANSMLGYDGPTTCRAQFSDWFATGDLVRLESDRYVFVGRQSDLINVGGNKVNPQEVEPILRSVEGVADVKVYGKRSSIAGQLVAAQIVAANHADAEIVKARVVEAAVRNLASYQRPRLIEMVDRIELSEAGKMVRR